MSNFFDAVKRYSGYSGYVRPFWDRYVQFVADHPRTSAWVIIGLVVLAVF